MRVGQSSSSVLLSSVSSSNSALMSVRSPRSSRWLPSRSAICLASAAMTSRTKISFASLCGRRERRARVLACVTMVLSRTTGSISTVSSTGCRGTSWRSLIALATTLAISPRPLISAASGDSRRVALMPGYSSATVASSTPVSPSEGSTCSM